MSDGRRGRVGILVTVEVDGVDFAERAITAERLIKRALGVPNGAQGDILPRILDVSEISTAAVNARLTVSVPKENV